MGCCNDKPMREKLLEHKESLLQFHKLSVAQIEKAFEKFEDLLSISYTMILELLKDLKITYSESDEKIVLKPFLSVFQKEGIKVEAEEDYDYRMLKAIMLLLCKSDETSKARALFEIFDVGHNNSLGITELDFMLRTILFIGDEISMILAGEDRNFQKNDVMERMKTEIFDKILRKTETLCFEGEKTDVLNADKFISKCFLVKSRLGYNFLSTAGIRKTLEDWFKFKESVRQNEPISFKCGTLPCN